MKDNTLSSVQTSPSDVSRFKSYRAHHFPYNSYSYAIETKGSESLGVGHGGVRGRGIPGGPLGYLELPFRCLTCSC